MEIPADAAKRLAEWKEQSPEQWLRTVSRYVPPVAAVVLVLAIAYRLAELTWLVVPGDSPAAPPPAVAAVRSTPGASSSLDSLANWHPFGEASQAAPEPAAEQVVDAPDTTLSLVLNGVWARADPEDGTASISSGRGEQKFYHSGAPIDGGNGATLHSVYENRVLINRSGRLETLRFPQPEELAGAAPPMARVAPPTPQNTGGSLREVLSANASRITDVIRASPHLEGGQMVGYRITPGRDRDAFAALGLEPGDVLTDVNGTVLNDMATSLQVFESLGEASMATVTVLREGTPQVIVIDMTQLQNIAENLE
jgi:general secretion pathway protein C